MAFECPKVGCKGIVEKPAKYGESAWNCPECGEDWFIMNLPQPKIGNKRKDPKEGDKK